MSWWGGRGAGGTETLRKIAAAISQKYKIDVAFHHGGEASHSEPDKRKISINLDQVYKHGEDYAVGLLLHEVAHVRYSPDTIPTFGGSKHKTADAGVYNWLEDRRIDDLMRDDYAGAWEFQDSLMTPTLDAAQAALERVSANDKAEDEWWLRALGLATLTAHKYQTDFCETGEVSLTKKARGELAEIYARINGLSTKEDVHAAAVEAIQILQPYLSEETGKKGQGGQGKEEGEEEGHGTHALRELGGHKTGPSGAGMADPEKCWLIADEAAQQVVPALKRKLMSKLRDSEREKWLGGQRRGRLDKKRLVQIAYKLDPRQIYRKRIEKKGKKYSFAVVLDTSGSMWNGGGAGAYSEDVRIIAGMKAAASIIRAVRGLGFRAGLTIYGAQSKTVLYPNEIYSPTVVHGRLMNTSSSFYQSNDNQTNKGIAEALTYLYRQPNEKVLVVVTDGGLDEEDVSYSKELIQAAKKKGVHTILYYVENDPRMRKILKDPEREKDIANAADLIPATVALLKSLQV